MDQAVVNVTNFTPLASCQTSDQDNGKYFLGAIYILPVTLGLLGNLFVIGAILKVVISSGLLTNVYLYVLGLSLTNFVYLSAGPFLIHAMITGTWAFGSVVCKFMFICEGLNKTLSIYLLVILSGDRYLAVCRPTTSAKYRSVKTAVTCLATAAVAVAVTNIPIYVYTKVYVSIDNPRCYECSIRFPMIEQYSDSTTIVELHSDSNRSTSNADYNQWRYSGTYYLLILIVLYYFLPAIFVCTFYVNIVSRLRRQYRLVSTRTGSSRKNRVAKSVLAVITFYFLCWTPYWLLQSVITFWPQLQYSSYKTFNTIMYLSYSIYTLPYINSCLDPILYAFLNKHLWTAYAAASASNKKRKRMKNSQSVITGSSENIINHI